MTPIRWTPRRKHEAIAAIGDGKLDRAAFMAEHQISAEEMAEWQRDAQLGEFGHKRGPFYRRAQRDQSYAK